MSNLSNSERLAAIADLKVVYWDLYKEVHNVRPRGRGIMESSDPSDLEYIQAEIDRLLVESERVVAEDRCREAESVVRFEAHVAMLIKMGASDRESALRWIHDADNTNGDADYLSFVWGLPYRYFACNKAA